MRSSSLACSRSSNSSTSSSDREPFSAADGLPAWRAGSGFAEYDQVLELVDDALQVPDDTQAVDAEVVAHARRVIVHLAVDAGDADPQLAEARRLDPPGDVLGGGLGGIEEEPLLL